MVLVEMAAEEEAAEDLGSGGATVAEAGREVGWAKATAAREEGVERAQGMAGAARAAARAAVMVAAKGEE